LYLDTDAVALDIGANIGVTSIIMSHYAPNGRVIGVEPGKRVFKLMNENLARNGIHNVQAFDYAVSSEPGTMAFHELSAFGHLHGHAGVDAADPDAVEVITLDQLVKKLGLERLDFIKIDTEGFEPQVFAGAQETIRRFKPVIQFELNTWTLMAAGKNDPLAFAATICQQFGSVYRINKTAIGLDLDVISAESSAVGASRTMIHDNIAFNQSWDDYLICSDPAKIKALHARVQKNRADQAAAGVHAAGPKRTFRQRVASKLRSLANKVEGA